MKIKIFIVTYQGEKHLRDNLRSMFASERFDTLDVEVNIINNHSNFVLDKEFQDRVNVYHNTLRADFSTGHLARNWNQAIINGFKSLVNPDCELLITSQDDVIWKSDWYSTLIEIMQKYTFYTSGNGDAFCCYRAEGVRNIGLWDERYCNIGFQEYDYFTRAVIYNGEFSSINDIGGGAQTAWNLCPHVTQFVHRDSIKLRAADESGKFNIVSNKVFNLKWGFDVSERDKNRSYFSWIKDNVKKPLSPCFFFYPYFEKDILDAKEKQYVI